MSVIQARPLPTRDPLSPYELSEIVSMFKTAGFEPHEGQRMFLSNRDRIKILFCGRRWGKSYTVALEMVMHILELIAMGWDYGRIRLCATNYSQIREPFAYFKRLCSALGLPLKVHSTREERYYYVGPVIVELRPLANRKGLRGAGVTMLIVDEVSQVKGDVFHYDLEPSTSDFKGRVLLAGTPDGINWVVEYAQSHGIDVPYTNLNDSYTFRSDDGECFMMRSPSWMNPHLDKSFIESKRSSMDPRAFAQEYAAEILVEHLEPFPIPPILLQQPLPPAQLYGAIWAIGLDYGYVDPSARVVVAKLADETYYVESVGYETHIESIRIPDWVKSELKSPRTPVVCDPSFWNEDGRSSLSDNLIKARIFAVKGSYHRVPRWALLRDLLAAGKIYVYEPRCKPLLQELENAYPKPGNTDDIEKPDHALSALTYALDYLYPRKPMQDLQAMGPTKAGYDARRKSRTNTSKHFTKIF